jgi:NADH-quinone oxidoreductase subunit G
VIVGGAALKARAGRRRAWRWSSLNLVREGWNGFNVLHTAAARTGGLMLGYAQLAA